MYAARLHRLRAGVSAAQQPQKKTGKIGGILSGFRDEPPFGKPSHWPVDKGYSLCLMCASNVVQILNGFAQMVIDPRLVERLEGCTVSSADFPDEVMYACYEAVSKVVDWSKVEADTLAARLGHCGKHWSIEQTQFSLLRDWLDEGLRCFLGVQDAEDELKRALLERVLGRESIFAGCFALLLSALHLYRELNGLARMRVSDINVIDFPVIQPDRYGTWKRTLAKDNWKGVESKARHRGICSSKSLICWGCPRPLLDRSEQQPHDGFKSGRLKCPDCKVATYCSGGCQHADWPLHKRLCRHFATCMESGCAACEKVHVLDAYKKWRSGMPFQSHFPALVLKFKELDAEASASGANRTQLCENCEEANDSQTQHGKWEGANRGMPGEGCTARGGDDDAEMAAALARAATAASVDEAAACQKAAAEDTAVVGVEDGTISDGARSGSGSCWACARCGRRRKRAEFSAAQLRKHKLRPTCKECQRGDW